jgi:hypothetical protein
MDNKVLPLHLSKYLYRSSWTILGSVMFALRYNHYDLAFISILSLMTSLLYWKDPIQKSYQQKLDRITIRSSFIYVLYRASKQWESIMIVDQQYYLFLMGFGIFLYISAKVISKFKSVSLYSCPLHFLFHIVANLSNMFLFSKLRSSVNYIK